MAAGIEMNREALRRAQGVEVLRFKDGEIVQFDDGGPASFFKEYLDDVASIEDMDESSRLSFPPGWGT